MTSQNTVCFVGNCQANNMHKAALAAGRDAKFLLFCTPDIRSEFGIKAARNYFKSIMDEEELRHFLVTSEIRINPCVSDLLSVQPSVFVYTLFHESHEYYVHNRTPFVVEVNLDRISTTEISKAVFKSLNRDFTKITVDHGTYLTRFLAFVSANTERFPDTRHCVVERISNSALKARAGSSLHEWDRLQNEVESTYATLNEFPNTHVLRTTPLLEKLLVTKGESTVFPFSFIQTFVDDHLEFKPFLDVEHPVDEYWGLVLSKVLQTHGHDIAPPLDCREDVALRNRLVERIISDDTGQFGAAVADFNPEEMINNVQELEAAWYLLGESATTIIRKLFEDNEEEIATNRKQSDLDKLRQLCSTTSPLEEWKTGKVALWGAGGRCLNIAKLLNRELDVACIFDCDPAKNGKQLCGIPISLPTRDLPPEFHVVIIIVTSTFFKEISGQIAAHPILGKARIVDSTNLIARMNRYRARVIPI